MDMLYISDLYKRFSDKKVLNGLNLSVPEHSIFGFIGKNGAGKTTTMKMVLGLLKADAGEIIVNGEKVVYGQTTTNRYIGYLPDVPEFYPFMTAAEYLHFCGEITGMKRTENEERCKDLLELVGLGNETHHIKGFSRGMKQRLGIAQAMLNDPHILILDEPTAGLDPKERVRFRNLISAFSKDRIVILSTHIVSDVEFIAEEIIMMKSGQIIHFGNPQEITSEIDGQVWECTVPTAYAEKYAAAYNTSNLRNTSENQTILRIIGDRPPMENAVRVQPTLEDLYLFYFKGGCEE